MASRIGFRTPDGLPEVLNTDRAILSASASTFASLPVAVQQTAGKGEFSSVLTVSGAGAGSIDYTAVAPNAKQETITITKLVTTNLWSVVGSVSGALANATTAIEFIDATAGVKFTITETVAFDTGDDFVVTVLRSGRELQANDDWHLATLERVAGDQASYFVSLAGGVGPIFV